MVNPGQATLGLTMPGQAWPGQAWPDEAWPSQARHGTAKNIDKFPYESKGHYFPEGAGKNMG